MLSKNRFSVTDMIYSKAAGMKIPISGTFELSPICNFTCKMCYVRKTQREVDLHLRPMVTLEQWLRIAKEASDAGMLFLLITGGEPFLWPDFWKLYEELIKMGFLISINTNGSLIDDNAIEYLTKLPPKRLNITLYGASDETYEELCGVKNVFHKVDEAIIKLKQAGIPVKLNSSVTPSNVKDIEKIITYAREKDLILEMPSYMFPPIRRDADRVGENHRFTPEDYAKYRLEIYRLQYGEEKYKEMLYSIRDKSVPPPVVEEFCRDPLDGRIRCRAGKATFWITWDGYMAPCGMMTDPKIDMYGKDFLSAWRELVEISGKVSLSGLCSTCPNMKICHACAAIALAETGTTEGIPIYFCKTMEVLQSIAKRELENIKGKEKERL